jgi:type II secretory pathway component PulF
MSVPSSARRLTVTVLAIFPWVLLLFQFLFVLPRYRKIYNELGLKLPRSAELSFDVSAWINRHIAMAYLATLTLIGVSVGAAYAVQMTPFSRSRRLLVLLLVFAIPCALFVASWLGVLSTQRRLAEGLNK